MNFCTKCGASITSHKHHVCKKTVSEVMNEMACPACGQDLNLPADINNEKLTALRSQLVECEKVAENMYQNLLNARNYAKVADENNWPVTPLEVFNTEDNEALLAYEAYKSAHPTEKG